MVDAQNRAQRSKDFKIKPDPSEPYADVLGDKELAELNKYGKVERDSDAYATNKQSIDEYEVQYDPNNDFAIFGIGDHTRGGV